MKIIKEYYNDQFYKAIPLYTFDELTPTAQDRAVRDYMQEREDGQYFTMEFQNSYESEIWECVRDLEKSIHTARVSWSYNRWYSCDFDVEYSYDDCYSPDYMGPAENTGYYASFDLCDVWNAHAKKLDAIYQLYDYVLDQQYKFPCYEWEFDGKPENKPMYERFESMADALVARWYTELERACDDVRNTIETLLRGEWEYYTSEEFARIECEDESTQGYESRTTDRGRVYYSDSRRWYTFDGAYFDQSNVTHECVSIVKL